MSADEHKIIQIDPTNADDVERALSLIPGNPLETALKQLRAVPDDAFFDKKDGLQVVSAASQIAQELTVGWRATDATFQIFDHGVWLRGDKLIEKAIAFLLGERYRQSHASAVKAMLEHLPAVHQVTDTPDPEYINVRNGLVNWRTSDLIPHDPDLCGTVQLQVDWDPAADCPNFRRFLSEVLPADAVEPSEQSPCGFIWEVLGYAVLPAGNVLQKAFMLVGAGGNGKSRFLHVLERLVGEHNVSAVGLYELVNYRFSPATLYGKTLNVCGDLDPKWLEDTATFKKLTGGDMLQAEHKYGQPFEFTPRAIPFYSVNKPFGTADTSDGFWRRWVMLPFPNRLAGSGLTADQVDRANTSPEELSGILRHAVGALPYLIARGHLDDPCHPPSVTACKNDFRAHGDRVRAWLEDCTAPAPHAEIKRSLLYQSFRAYIEEDEHGKPLRDRDFYARLEQVPGVSYVTIHGERRARGLQLKRSHA